MELNANLKENRLNLLTFSGRDRGKCKMEFHDKLGFFFEIQSYFLARIKSKGFMEFKSIKK